MVEMCHSLTRTLRPVVGGHKFLLDGVDANLLDATTDPDLLCDQTVRHRVVGLVELDVAVAVDLDLFPDRHVVESL